MLLNVHSYYSLRYGTNSVDELVGLLVHGGYDTAVLTDINNSTGVLEFIKVCAAKGIRGLAGMEYRKGDKLCISALQRMLKVSGNSMNS